MQIKPEILNILDASALDGRALRLPPGALPRQTYLAVNKVIEAAGGKWDRKAKAHLFEGEAADVMDQIIATGEVISKKQEMQQFWTPAPLADALVALAELRPEHLVLEPSAGEGALIRAALKIVAPINIFAVETDARAMDKWPAAVTWRAFGDFLELTPATRYDRVLMNPPFTRQADIRHVSHAMGFLKPGGRLVAIMSAGTMFRQNSLAVAFRATMGALDRTFQALPPGSFKESGTMVNACIVTVDLPQ